MNSKTTSLFLSSCLLLIGANSVFGQHSKDILETRQDSTSSPCTGLNHPDFFTMVEDMPKYPGGDGEMLNFLKQNLQYPEDAKTKGETGVVYVSYIVFCDGSVGNVKVVRGVSSAFNDEAKRVVSLLKGYQPGLQRSKPVNVQFVVPVRFEL